MPSAPTRPWMSDLGEQIRRAREKSDLSQEELGNRIGKSRVTINGYENGRGNPEFRVIASIAAALGEPFTVLGCRIGPEDATKALNASEQLCFEFDREVSYLATLTIRPARGTLAIRVDAKVTDKLA